MLRTLRIILGTVFLCASFVCSWAQSQQPRPRSLELSSPQQAKTSQQTKQADTDQRGTNNSPLIIQIAPSPNAQEEAAQTKIEHEEKAASDRRSEITTDLIAVATLIQAVALVVTIIVMIRNGRRQLRAYIDMMKATIVGIEKDEPLRVNIFVKNAGQTPARNVAWISGMTMKDLPFDEELRVVDFNRPGVTNTHLGAGLEMGHTAPDPKINRILTEKEKTSLKEGKKAIFVYGEIRYIDIFHKPHVTRYQMIYGGAVGASPDSLFVCEKGNYSD